MKYWFGFSSIVYREFLKFTQQKTRFASSLVRPLLWLIVFAAGFRAALGISIIEPYATYINYEEYILPGLCAMVLLFNSMQSALSIVYDREMGSIKLLLTSPLPRWFLILSKQIASSLVSLLQVYAFLGISYLYGIEPPSVGFFYALPACFITAMMLSGLGIVIASYIHQLENFAGVMNFVIFPMFFMSSALYPLWKMQESSEWLYQICRFNPFTYCVELIRYALYSQFNQMGTIIVVTLAVLFSLLASYQFNLKKQ